MNFLWVALGGAAGAAARYAVSLLPIKAEFPVLTFLTNLLGAILIGFMTGIFARQEVPAGQVLFWKTGVCGGFTTFSTFSLEAYILLEKKAFLTGSLYMLCSVLCCILGIWCGRKLSALCIR